MLVAQDNESRCIACGSAMNLTAIDPGDSGQDLRTFSCRQCKTIEQRIIESAVTEAWLVSGK
jgi:hypothetical protein